MVCSYISFFSVYIFSSLYTFKLGWMGNTLSSSIFNPPAVNFSSLSKNSSQNLLQFSPRNCLHAFHLSCLCTRQYRQTKFCEKSRAQVLNIRIFQLKLCWNFLTPTFLSFLILINSISESGVLIKLTFAYTMGIIFSRTINHLSIN